MSHDYGRNHLYVNIKNKSITHKSIAKIMINYDHNFPYSLIFAIDLQMISPYIPFNFFWV